MEFTERANILACLVRKAVAKNSRLGKIQLQKLVLFLQSAGVEMGYPVTMYHYGPYSHELTFDLDRMKNSGYLHVSASQDGYGFIIRLGSNADSLSTPDDAVLRKLDQVLDMFGQLSSSDIELSATCFYVSEKLFASGNWSKDIVATTVKSLKPKFSEESISTELVRLISNGWITPPHALPS